MSTTNVVRHDHDLDTRETQSSQRRARSTTLDGDYAKMFEKMQDNQRAQKASERRRGRARPDEKKGAYKLLELVVAIAPAAVVHAGALGYRGGHGKQTTSIEG